VAIKKIKPMAAHTADAKHVLREVRLMRYLSAHPNIITMHDLFADVGDDELYIVMELLDSDLHRIIQSPQPLTEAHNRYFMYQLIRGIKYLHDHDIIHRDLKPGNLLVTRNCDLRITDFGLAREHPKRGECGVNDPNANMDGDHVDDAERMTQHVVTRWYRPPELMLCPDGLYSYYVDIWSAGCIFAELLGRKPLFPGKNFVHQLQLIFDVIGAPKESDVAHITNKQARKFLSGVRGKVKRPFQEIFKDAPQLVIELLDELLMFEPNDRCSARAALEHPYFAPFEPGKETEPPIHPDFNFDFEKKQLPRSRLRQMIIDEVASFRQEVRNESGNGTAAAAAAAAATAGVARKGGGSSAGNQNSSASANTRPGTSAKAASSSSTSSMQNGNGVSKSASSSSATRATSASTSQRLRQQSKPPVPSQQQMRSQRPSSGAAVRSRAEAAAARAAAEAASTAEESLRRAIENSEGKHDSGDNVTKDESALPVPPSKSNAAPRSPNRSMDRAKTVAMPSPPASSDGPYSGPSSRDMQSEARAAGPGANGASGASAYEDQWRRKEQERRRIREEQERQEEMQRRQQAVAEAKEEEEYAEYEMQRQREREVEERRRAVQQAEREAEEAEQAALERRRKAERERLILEQEAAKAEAEAAEKRRAARLAKAKEDEEIQRLQRLSSASGRHRSLRNGGGYASNDIDGDYDSAADDDVGGGAGSAQRSLSEEKVESPARPVSRGVVHGRPQSAAHGNFRGSSRPSTAQAERSGRPTDADDDLRGVPSGGGVGGRTGGDYSHRPPSGAGVRPASRGISGYNGAAINGYHSGSNLAGSQSPGARSNGGSSRGSSPRNGTATRVDSAGVPRYAAATAASNRATTASGLRRYSSTGSASSGDLNPPQYERERGDRDYRVDDEEIYGRGVGGDGAKGYVKSSGDPYRQQQQRATSAPRGGVYQRSGSTGLDRSVLEGRDYSPPQRRAVVEDQPAMRQAATNLAFGGGGHQAGAGKKPKKQVTVPKSPNFSKMSWQRDNSSRRRESSDPNLARHYVNSSHGSRYNRDGAGGGRNLRDRPSMPESAAAQALKSRYGTHSDQHNHRGGGGGIMGPQRTSTAGQQRSSSRGRLPMGAQREQPPPARKIRY
jgi:serine/threonine protein kinase